MYNCWSIKNLATQQSRQEYRHQERHPHKHKFDSPLEVVGKERGKTRRRSSLIQSWSRSMMEILGLADPERLEIEEDVDNLERDMSIEQNIVHFVELCCEHLDEQTVDDKLGEEPAPVLVCLERRSFSEVSGCIQCCAG